MLCALKSTRFQIKLLQNKVCLSQAVQPLIVSGVLSLHGMCTCQTYHTKCRILLNSRSLHCLCSPTTLTNKVCTSVITEFKQRIPLLVSKKYFVTLHSYHLLHRQLTSLGLNPRHTKTQKSPSKTILKKRLK